MRIPFLLAVVAVASNGSVSRADGALDEVSAGNTPQTATSPQTAWAAEKLGAMWDANDRWQLRFDFTATHDYASAPTSGSFGDSAVDIYLGNLSAEYDADPHWMFKVVLGG